MADRRHFDPTSLHDPVALSTPWKPNSPGGANFRTHWLDAPEPDVRVFRATVGARLFAAVFVVSGLAVSVPALHELSRAFDAAEDLAGPGMAFAFGILFAFAGLWLGWSGSRPIVFHRGRELFWRGWGEPEAGQPGVEPLGRLHALQIISESCGTRSRYLSYELNLVFVDGRRVTVIDHGNLGALREDAVALAQYLRVPLWDPRDG